MTARTGVDLHHLAPGRADPLGIEPGLLIPFDHKGFAGPGVRADRALQQRGLAGAGGAHQVDRGDPVLLQAMPVRRRQPVVLRQNLLLQQNRPGLLDRRRVPVSLAVFVSLARCVLVRVLVLVLVVVRVFVVLGVLVVGVVRVVVLGDEADPGAAAFAGTSTGAAHVSAPPPR